MTWLSIEEEVRLDWDAFASRPWRSCPPEILNALATAAATALIVRTEEGEYDARLAQAGESVVGWYRSASSLKPLFTFEDEALFNQLFPQQAMLALVIERTKDQPCRGILYARHLEQVIHAIVELGSPRGPR